MQALQTTLSFYDNQSRDKQVPAESCLHWMFQEMSNSRNNNAYEDSLLTLLARLPLSYIPWLSLNYVLYYFLIS